MKTYRWQGCWRTEEEHGYSLYFWQDERHRKQRSQQRWLWLLESAEYASPEEWHSLDIVLQQVERKLMLQLDVADSYDRKLELLLGLTGVILAAAFGLGRGSSAVQGIGTYLVIAAVGLLMTTGLVAVVAYLPRKLSRPPDPEFFRIQYLSEDEALTKRDLADAMVVAYNNNQPIIQRKAGLLKGSLVMLWASVVLFGVALLKNVFS